MGGAGDAEGVRAAAERLDNTKNAAASLIVESVVIFGVAEQGDDSVLSTLMELDGRNLEVVDIKMRFCRPGPGAMAGRGARNIALRSWGV